MVKSSSLSRIHSAIEHPHHWFRLSPLIGLNFPHSVLLVPLLTSAKFFQP